MRTRKPKTSAIAFTILGILGIVIVLFLLMGNIRLFCYGTTAEGVVVSSKKYTEETNGNKTVYVNSAEYVVDGTTYRLNAFSSTKYPILNESVTIHYNPNNPSEACTTIWKYGDILFYILLLSFLCFGMSVYFFWKARNE